MAYENAKIEDLKFEAVNMGQALTVVADLVISYIGQMRPSLPIEGATSEEDGFKKYQQMAIAIVVYRIASAAKHKKEMAHILHAIAADLEDPPPSEEEAGPDRPPQEIPNDLPNGARQHGSTGQLWEAFDGRLVRVK